MKQHVVNIELREKQCMGRFLPLQHATEIPSPGSSGIRVVADIVDDVLETAFAIAAAYESVRVTENVAT